MAAMAMVAGLGRPSRPGLLSAAAPHPVCCLLLPPLADSSPSTPPASPPSQGTTYQKTDATVEMKRLNREQFWEQAKVGYERGQPLVPRQWGEPLAG